MIRVKVKATHKHVLCPISIALAKREYLVIIRDNFVQILVKNICCDPSSEPSGRDGSDEGSQHMVSFKNKKNYPELSVSIFSYLELC